MREQPLLDLDPHFGLNGFWRSARPGSADQLQPVSVVLVQVPIQERFGIQRQKEIRRIVAQRVAKETRRSDSHYGEWPVIEIEDAADDGRIRPVHLLP